MQKNKTYIVLALGLIPSTLEAIESNFQDYSEIGGMVFVSYISIAVFSFITPLFIICLYVINQTEVILDYFETTKVSAWERLKKHAPLPIASHSQ